MSDVKSAGAGGGVVGPVEMRLNEFLEAMGPGNESVRALGAILKLAQEIDR